MSMYVKYDDRCDLVNSGKPKLYEVDVSTNVPIQQPSANSNYFVDISEAAKLPNDAIVVPESLRNMILVCSGMSGQATAYIESVTLSNYSTPFNNEYNVGGNFVFDKNCYDGRLTVLYGNIKYFRLSELLH